MDSTVDLFIRERLSRLGREIRWFDMPVHAKIEAVSKKSVHLLLASLFHICIV